MNDFTASTIIPYVPKLLSLSAKCSATALLSILAVTVAWGFDFTLKVAEQLAKWFRQKQVGCARDARGCVRLLDLRGFFFLTTVHSGAQLVLGGSRPRICVLNLWGGLPAKQAIVHEFIVGVGGWKQKPHEALGDSSLTGHMPGHTTSPPTLGHDFADTACAHHKVCVPVHPAGCRLCYLATTWLSHQSRWASCPGGAREL